MNSRVDRKEVQESFKQSLSWIMFSIHHVKFITVQWYGSWLERMTSPCTCIMTVSPILAWQLWEDRNILLWVLVVLKGEALSSGFRMLLTLWIIWGCEWALLLPWVSQQPLALYVLKLSSVPQGSKSLRLASPPTNQIPYDYLGGCSHVEHLCVIQPPPFFKKWKGWHASV